MSAHPIPDAALDDHLTLVRRDLAEIWYRQTLGQVPAMRGPLFSLSVGGGRLAGCFLDDDDVAPLSIRPAIRRPR